MRQNAQRNDREHGGSTGGGLTKDLVGVLLALLLVPTIHAGAQMISGRVVQQGTDVAIVEALVSISDERGEHQRTVRTSSSGTFSFRLNGPGQVEIRVRRLGFRPFVSAVLRVEAGDTLTVPVMLMPVPQELSRVTVNAELEAIKDLRIVGYNARSMEAIFVPPSKVEAVGKDAFTYLDVVNRLRLTFVNVTDTCVQKLMGGGCLPLYVDDWFISADPEQLQLLRRMVDPNDIDHIVFVRGGALAGTLHIYTRDYTARQRQRRRPHAASR
jgi:hypothetical protein